MAFVRIIANEGVGKEALACAVRAFHYIGIPYDLKKTDLISARRNGTLATQMYGSSGGISAPRVYIAIDDSLELPTAMALTGTMRPIMAVRINRNEIQTEGPAIKTEINHPIAILASIRHAAVFANAILTASENEGTVGILVEKKEYGPMAIARDIEYVLARLGIKSYVSALSDKNATGASKGTFIIAVDSMPNISDPFSRRVASGTTKPVIAVVDSDDKNVTSALIRHCGSSLAVVNDGPNAAFDATLFAAQVFALRSSAARERLESLLLMRNLFKNWIEYDRSMRLF